MKQDRPIQALDLLKVAAQRLKVMAIDWPKVNEPKLFEQHSVAKRGLYCILELLKPALCMLTY